MSKYLTVEQAAKYMNISKRTLYNRKYAGDLPFYKINGKGRPLFLIDDLENLFKRIESYENQAEEIINRNTLRGTSINCS